MSTRTPSLDVARAIALIGVVVMNYHAYLNPKTAYFQVAPSIWDRAFNPLSGILTSRFAAAFVLIAGIGVSLMTNRVREAGNVEGGQIVELQNLQDKCINDISFVLLPPISSISGKTVWHLLSSLVLG